MFLQVNILVINIKTIQTTIKLLFNLKNKKKR